MNTFGFLKLRTAPVWGTVLASATVFAGGAVCQLGSPCQSCSAPTTTCPTTQCVEKPCTAVKTVYKTVTSKEQVTTMEPLWTTEMRTRKTIVSKPVTETTMVTETYTVEVPYTEVSYRTEKVQVTDYVEETAEREEVQTVCQPVTKTGTREEVFTEEVPVTETVMVNQTRMVPVEETAYETTVEDHGYFKEETELKPRTVLFPSKLEWQSAKDVTDCKTGESVHKPAGLYWTPRDTQERGTYKVKKVWVPNEVEVQKPVVKTVMKQVCEQVPQTVTRTETRTVKKMVPYTYTENVQTQVVRKVPHKVLKPVTRTVEKQVPVTETKYRKEVRTRQVPKTVCRMVQEEKYEQYPVQVCKQVPVTKTECVSRVIPQTVPTVCCPYTPAQPACCPAPSTDNRPGTPSSSTPVPPAQYQSPAPASAPQAEPAPKADSAPVATSSKSILNRDEKVEPVTYTQPADTAPKSETKADDVTNAKFEQVYSAGEATPKLSATKPENTVQATPTTPVDSQPREIKAPATKAEPAATTPAQPKVDVNAQSGQVRNTAVAPVEKSDANKAVTPKTEVKPIPTNGPLY